MGSTAIFTFWSLLFLLLISSHLISMIDPNETHRQKIRTTKDTDQCRCWKRFFGDKRAKRLAKRDCKDALIAFQALPQSEQDSVCPHARKPKCRGQTGKSFLSWSCSFLCDLTSEDRTIFYTRRLQEPPPSITKNLHEILVGIGRHKAHLDSIERFNSRFPSIVDA